MARRRLRRPVIGDEAPPAWAHGCPTAMADARWREWRHWFRPSGTAMSGPRALPCTDHVRTTGTAMSGPCPDHGALPCPDHAHTISGLRVLAPPDGVSGPRARLRDRFHEMHRVDIASQGAGRAALRFAVVTGTT